MLLGEITKRATIDVLRHGIKHGPRHLDLFYGTPSPGDGSPPNATLPTPSPTEESDTGGPACAVRRDLLLSALRIHGFATRDPFEVPPAIKRKSRRPRTDYPPLRLVYLSGAALPDGAEEHDLHGQRVRVFGAAKTVVRADAQWEKRPPGAGPSGGRSLVPGRRTTVPAPGRKGSPQAEGEGIRGVGSPSCTQPLGCPRGRTDAIGAGTGMDGGSQEPGGRFGAKPTCCCTR